jgi:hypothetical protein
MYGVKNKKITRILDDMLKKEIKHVKIDYNPAFHPFIIIYMDTIEPFGHFFTFADVYKEKNNKYEFIEYMEVLYIQLTEKIYPLLHRDRHGFFYKAVTFIDKYSWQVNIEQQKGLSDYLRKWLNKVVKEHYL